MERIKARFFFSSDQHFNHSNIIKYSNRPFLCPKDRAFYENHGNSWHDGNWKNNDRPSYFISKESTKMMDEALLEGINKTVGEDDVLFLLGDFAFAPKDKYFDTCLYYKNRIACKNIHYIMGNHDHWTIKGIFSSAENMTEIVVSKIKITLCHYAMAVWNKSHRGSWHLYGHSHADSEQWLEKVFPGRFSMDVGVDNAYKLLGEYRPFSFEEIRDILGKKKGHHQVRH